MPKCSYCSRNYEVHEGLTLVDIVGKIKYYCSSKCRKYALMNRTKGKWAISKGKTEEEVKAREVKEKASK